MIRTTQFKYVCCYGSNKQEKIREQFFDLSIDAEEKVNRISEEVYQGKIEELRQRMEEFFEKYSDEVNAGIQYPVTGSGQMKLCHEDEAFDQMFSHYYQLSR